MPYENIPGVGVTYLDGAFLPVGASTQPRILLLGACSKGLTYSLYRIASTGQAEAEFGMENELFKPLHEGLSRGADNYAIMRVGGRPGQITITDSDGGSLRVTPTMRDAEVMERYALIIQAIDTDDDTVVDTNRILVYDLEKEAFVYDTLEEKAFDTGIVDVDDDGFALTDLNDPEDPDSATSLDDLVGGDLTYAGAGVAPTYTVTNSKLPSDGTGMTWPEWYAALNEAYRLLDFQDADVVIPVGVFADVPNLASGATPDYSTGLPEKGSAGDALGKVWQYEYRGKTYTYMVQDDDVVDTDLATLTPDPGAGSATLVFTAVTAGPAGENVTIEFVDDVLAGAEAVTVSGSAITIHFEDGGSTGTQVETAYNAVAGAVALASVAVTDGGDPYDISAGQIDTPLRLSLAGVLKHDDLTGDTVPSAVETRWRASVLAEYRECNFAHQLASFCHHASTTWRPMFGIISMMAPTEHEDEDGHPYGYSIGDISAWVGVLPTYEEINTTLGIDGAGNNGAGLLGYKFLAGEAGYRDAQIEDSTTTQGLAYGGFVLTKGTGLPNSTPYGIDDDDEAVDDKSRPIDIGRYLFVTYDWPILRSSYNGGSTYRGNFVGPLAAKLVTTPANQEPIGTVNGKINGLGRTPKILAPQLDRLAKLRYVGVRFDPTVGYMIVQAKTAAHPSSDYARSSTTRSVAVILQGIRDLCQPSLGKPFAQERLLSLQSDLDEYLRAQRTLGYHQGAVARMSYTRSDRILGRLKIRLQVIPPFSIESIMVELSLAAEEAELAA